MKKRLFSILLALCIVLCLVPTTAFAESETEEPPVCTCETACTAEAMNADCPICGAEALCRRTVQSAPSPQTMRQCSRRGKCPTPSRRQP